MRSPRAPVSHQGRPSVPPRSRTAESPRCSSNRSAGVPGGAPSLALASGRLLAGTRAFVETHGRDDGGTASWETGACATPLDSPGLLLGQRRLRVRQGVPARGRHPPCTADEERLLLRALDARGGAVRWEAVVLPFDAPGALHEAVLLKGGLAGRSHGEQLPSGTLS